MRRIFSRIMIVIVLGLAAIIIVAKQHHTTPKSLVQSWFSHTGSSTTISGDTAGYGAMTGSTETSTTSGQLSEDDKKQVDDLMNSLGQNQ